MNRNELKDHPILIYDGQCGLCNRAVDYVLRHDHRRVFRYASNTSEPGKSLLREFGYDVEPPPETMIVVMNDRSFTKSDAAIVIAVALGGWRRMAATGRLVPKFIRNACYDFVARNRYRWFGRHETCRLIKPEEASLFLDG